MHGCINMQNVILLRHLGLVVHRPVGWQRIIADPTSSYPVLQVYVTDTPMVTFTGTSRDPLEIDGGIPQEKTVCI